MGYREESSIIFSDLQAGTQQIAERSPFIQGQFDGTTKSSGTLPFRRGFFPGCRGTRLATSNYRELVQRNPIGVAPPLSAPQVATDEIAPCPAVKNDAKRRTSGCRFPSCQCATEELENGTTESDCLEVAHHQAKFQACQTTGNVRWYKWGFLRREGRKSARGICWPLLR